MPISEVGGFVRGSIPVGAPAVPAFDVVDLASMLGVLDAARVVEGEVIQFSAVTER